MKYRDGRNQDKLGEIKYRENNIKGFTVLGCILLWNSLPREVEEASPDLYKLDRQNIWKYMIRLSNFIGILCLNRPYLSLASTVLFSYSQFSMALPFQSIENTETWRHNLKLQAIK